MNADDVVISGFAAYFPEADNLSEFKTKLYAGVDMVTDDGPRWPPGMLSLPKRMGKIRDLSRFDAQFFGVHARQAPALDPQQRLLLERTYEAIFDAGYDPSEFRGQKVGVFIGCCGSEAGFVCSCDTHKMAAFGLLGCSMAMLSNRISYAMNFHGPSVMVDTACSSTMTALNEAVLALRSGQCEAAVVGGSSLVLLPTSTLGFVRLEVLSPDGKCRAFDANRKGYARSESVGTFFLQRASAARRVYAKVVHVNANHDGFKTEGITYPSGRMHEQLFADAYAESKIDPREVTYIEAHGTGTVAGDPVELGSISRFFCHAGREQPLLIGSVKSNVGHCEGASGIPSVAKAILAFETGIIAGNLHFSETIPGIASLQDGSMVVVDKPTPFPGGLLAINSYGLGGANVHTILQGNPGSSVENISREDPEVPRLVLMAGRTKDSLTNTLNRAEEEGPYPDSAYALLNRVGQPSINQFPFRGYALVPVDGTQKEVVKVVEQAPFERRPLWFVFTGMGCQWNGMARQMMHFKLFARSIRKSHEVLKPFGVDLIGLVTSEEVDSDDKVAPFVSITGIQVALVDMLNAIGMKPDGILGHSTGEVGASYADGCFTAEEAMLCAYWRGRCVEMMELPRGAMAAVGLTWKQATERCRDGVVPACHNAEDSVTISGPADAVAKLVEELQAENVFAREVKSLNVAFHSEHVHCVGPSLLEALKKVIPKPKPRTKRWISSSVPETLWPEPMAQFCSAEYHVNNFLSPVRFCEALQHVPKDAIVVEIAPHSLLQAILRRELGTTATCLGLMKRHVDNLTFFLSSLGKLHTLGFQLDLSRLYPPVPSPVPRGTPNLAHLVSWDHSEKWNVDQWNSSPWARITETVFNVSLDEEEHSYLAGHKIDGRVLFPAAGYMVLAWQCFTKTSIKPFNLVPVVFEDVAFLQATILPKNGTVKFLVDFTRATGQFVVCQSGMVVATGRVRVADDGEQLLDEDPPHVPDGTLSYELDAEDIYKELRLHGYEYQGAFKGIIKADLNEPCGKLRWANNWVTFIDSMLQTVTLSNPLRSLCLPVKIRSCIVDPRVHARVVDQVGEAGVDVLWDPCLNMIRAGGIAVRGLKPSVAPRRALQQVPSLQTYQFVPYIDDEHASHQREMRVGQYAQACSYTAKLMLESYGSEKDAIFENECVSEAIQDVPSLYCQNPVRDHALLRVLNTVLRQTDGTQSSLVTAVQSVFSAQKGDLERDLLNVDLLQEDTLRELVDVVLENNSITKIQVLELAAQETKLVLAGKLFPLLSASDGALKIQYTLAHPSPSSIAAEELPEAVTKIASEGDASNKNGLSEADLIVAHELTTGSDNIERLVKNLSSGSRDRSFILLAYRTALTPAERLLSKLGHVSPRVHITDNIESMFRACGFRLVALRSNNLSALALLRKCTNISATKSEVIKVTRSGFDWVEILKEKAKEYESRPVGETIFLLADGHGLSGIVGLTNCLRMETGGSYIRCLFDASQGASSSIADFSPGSSKYKELLEKYLVMNIYKDGKWGSYRQVTGHFGGDPKITTEFAYLDIQTRGDLSSLKWYKSSFGYSKPLGVRGEARIPCTVHYAPLNFKDIMLATGRIPTFLSAAKLSTTNVDLGIEFSGHDFEGRRVMGVVSSEAIATVVAADPIFLWEIPEEWSLEEASTVPVAYATAYCALRLRADLQPGESLLVHTGSGGVGQAAIRIALHMGCTVFTTVGSQEKRDYLKRLFPPLEDRHFASSRDVSFRKHILSETKGKGVNVVLNSLSEEKLRASLECLADHGRFLEIGKFDIYNDSSLGMYVFNNNVSFYGVQLDYLGDNDVATLADKTSVAELLQEGITSGVVRPLEVIRFTRDNVEEAFRFMGTGEHIGKIVIQIRPDESPSKILSSSPITVEAVPRTYFYEHKSYVIAGGLGGFGLELADWMVSRGCRKLLLTGRSGVQTGYQRLCLRRWHSHGATVLTSSRDISVRSGAIETIKEATAMGPVGGIFNLAMVLRDAVFENQTSASFEAVCKPKIDGTQLLDELSRELCPELDHFVVFSSLISARGKAGQSNYGYANSFMERICEQRVAEGLPGMAIQWGPIGEVGVLYETLGYDAELCGAMSQRIRSCMDVMDQFMNQRKPVVSSFVPVDPSSLFESNAKRNLTDIVKHVLGVKDLSSVNPSTSLGELGMDSLVGVELKQIIERDYDVVLSMQQVRELTIKRLQEINDCGAVWATVNRTAALKTKEHADETRDLGPSYEELMQKFLPNESLVEMNGLQDGLVFIVHPIQGDVGALMEVASHMSVRAVGVQRTPNVIFRSIEELAATYVEKLQELQPSGPYHLAGFSFGATVAHEIALQLQNSGAPVGSVTFLDGTPWMGTNRKAREASGLGRDTEHMDDLFFSYILTQFVDIDYNEALNLISECPNWEAKCDASRDAILKDMRTLESTRHTVDTGLRALYETFQAMLAYEPSTTYHGKIVLVRSSNPFSYFQTYKFPFDYGVSELCDGDVDVKVIEGDHSSVVVGPGAKQCAAIISEQVKPDNTESDFCAEK